MAIIQGQLVEAQDLTSIYTSFNTFINTYGGNISQLSIPANNAWGKVLPTHLNTLHAKLTEFREDECLGTQSSWWASGTDVSSNALLQASSFDAVETAIDNFAKVKCRNIASYTNGTNGNGKNSHSNNGYSNRNYSSKSNGDESNGGKYNGNRGFSGCNGYGECTSNGSNGAYGHCSSNGACTSNGACSSNGACGSNGNCTAKGSCKPQGTCTDIVNAKTVA